MIGLRFSLVTESFHETCAEDVTLAMGDETTKIFLNSKGRREGINQNLAAFLDYIEGKTPKGKFTETIADAVEAAKENKEMKVEYMTFFMELRRREEKGREEGIAKGRAEGLAEGEAKGLAEGKAKGLAEGREEGMAKGRWTTLAELVREGILTLQEAAKKAGMSEEHFRKLAAL